ncbi:MAG: glycosyltransferase [Pikeienuella sp.]
MKHLLVANIWFAPRSFGGATIVAEEIARRVAAHPGWRVSVISSSNYGAPQVPTVIRTRLPGDVDHYTINFGGENENPPDAEFENPAVTAEIRRLIASLKPDAAHVHCIQGLGVGLIDMLEEAGVPTILTTHDYWWLCEKIFMLNALGRFCGQEVIDRKICASCVFDGSTLDRRWERAQATLRKPAALTYPSRTARRQYEINGAPRETGMVLSNGVTRPGPDYQALRAAKPSRRLRFGYIGGPGPLKGWAMIERAFRALDPEKVELVVVDAATQIGGTWWSNYRFGPLERHVTIVPAYTRETIDEFFAGIDVLLFLSTWRETFGLTSREAALRGVHVLATDCGAPIEHLIDGDTATVLKGFGSARALRAAARRLAERGVPAPSEAGLARIAEEIITYEDQTAEVIRLLDRITAPEDRRSSASG